MCWPHRIKQGDRLEVITGALKLEFRRRLDFGWKRNSCWKRKFVAGRDWNSASARKEEMECGTLRMSVKGILCGLGKEAYSWRTKLSSNCPQQVQRRRTFQAHALSTQAATTGRRARREQNVEGEFYVDHTCIDCDMCRWMAPEVFSRIGELSAVHKQPSTSEERLKSLQALVSCPTGSIRTVTPAKDVRQAQDTFPFPIDDDLPGVYHCGFHSEKSYGAASYFVQREDGNILVDSPRFTERLAKRLEAMGGVQYMFLTHIDDVADHKEWQKRFNCERILHTMEVQADTAQVERKLEGTGPWTLGTDVEMIFTPGHTPGHVCLLLKDRQVLFSGDHISASMENEICVDTEYNWYSVEKQLQSMEALTASDFTWVLPGHMRRYRFEDLDDKNATIKEVVAQYRSLNSGRYNL